jgi:periplasmic copper chaperone A
MLIRTALRALALSCGLFPALSEAHVTVEGLATAWGAEQTASFLVGHGCSGSPTIRVKIRIPEGIVEIRPAEKQGWTLDVVSAPYASVQHLKGAAIKEGVREVIWFGELPTDRQDRFIIYLSIADEISDQESVLFPVVQECRNGVENWIDEGEDDDHPAPRLMLQRR